jgi:hypothetical protein
MATLYSPKIVTNGLVMYLDAGNNRSYPGSGTSWSDLSRNNNSGSLLNGPTFNTANAGSIVFDGSNDYTSTAFSFSSRPFSINCWIYFNSLTNWQSFVGQDSTLTDSAAIYFQKTHNTQIISPTLNNVVGLVLNFTDNTGIRCDDTTVVTTGVWYNYCVSVSTTDINLYKYGALVAATGSNKTMATTVGKALVGVSYWQHNLADYCNARISHVSIYNRALSAAEIRQNYHATKGRFGL